MRSAIARALLALAAISAPPGGLRSAIGRSVTRERPGLTFKPCGDCESPSKCHPDRLAFWCEGCEGNTRPCEDHYSTCPKSRVIVMAAIVSTPLGFYHYPGDPEEKAEEIRLWMNSLPLPEGMRFDETIVNYGTIGSDQCECSIEGPHLMPEAD